MQPPDHLRSDEKLGRQVSSSTYISKLKRGDVPPVLFVREGSPEVSTDRLHSDYFPDVANSETDFHKNRGRTFYGWAVISQDKLSQIGLAATPSPTPDNPYHADIILPLSPEPDRHEIYPYAVKLAAKASWKSV